MTNEEKKIYQAARAYVDADMPKFDRETNVERLKCFTDGVLSETARKYWEPKWISVKEKLPNINQKILAITNEGFIRITWVDAGTLDFDEMDLKEHTNEHYTHWMEFPLPPNK